MTLNAESIAWASEFVSRHSDGDLFPRILEFEAINQRKDEFVKLIEGKPLSSFNPGAHRRFIVPKDEFSYRQATQLDPQDSLLLTAAVRQFGQGIEARRLPSQQIYSYRFLPEVAHGLYGHRSAWNDFWRAASFLSW